MTNSGSTAAFVAVTGGCHTRPASQLFEVCSLVSGRLSASWTAAGVPS